MDHQIVQISQKAGVPAYLIDDAKEIQDHWLDSKKNIGLTAGASAPEILVEEVITKLKKFGANIVKESPGIKESVVFSLPRELTEKSKRNSVKINF